MKERRLLPRESRQPGEQLPKVVLHGRPGPPRIAGLDGADDRLVLAIRVLKTPRRGQQEMWCPADLGAGAPGDTVQPPVAGERHEQPVHLLVVLVESC